MDVRAHRPKAPRATQSPTPARPTIAFSPAEPHSIPQSKSRQNHSAHQIYPSSWRRNRQKFFLSVLGGVLFGAIIVLVWHAVRGSQSPSLTDTIGKGASLQTAADISNADPLDPDKEPDQPNPNDPLQPFKSAVIAAAITAAICQDDGNEVLPGKAGDRICATGDTEDNVWPILPDCGLLPKDALWMVRQGNQADWSFTVECKNLSRCSDEVNTLCDANGCHFSDNCQ